MSESSQKPKLVRAIYNFQPTNTDEVEPLDLFILILETSDIRG